MAKSWIDYRIRQEFHSIPKLLLYFSISLIELTLALTILALQIVLIVTSTCIYYIGVGFWSMPFLLLCPISIWIVIWRRSSLACLISIIVHFLATLFATSVIIISFLVLIDRLDCSNMSLTKLVIPLNSSLIGIAGLFKLMIYIQLCLFFRLRRNTDRIPTIFTQEISGKPPPYSFFSTASRTTSDWSITSNETIDDLDSLFV